MSRAKYCQIKNPAENGGARRSEIFLADVADGEVPVVAVNDFRKFVNPSDHAQTTTINQRFQSRPVVNRNSVGGVHAINRAGRVVEVINRRTAENTVNYGREKHFSSVFFFGNASDINDSFAGADFIVKTDDRGAVDTINIAEKADGARISTARANFLADDDRKRES